MAFSINGSVGLGGENQTADVQAVTSLLNNNLRFLKPIILVPPDNISELVRAIRAFQRRVALFSNPDGRVDPNGKTLRLLNLNAKSSEIIPDYRFPLAHPAVLSYREGGRQFAAGRNGRFHAACDLVGDHEQDVFAMEDGKITEAPYSFFDGTLAFEVTHKGGMVCRYCETHSLASGLSLGAHVQKGDLLSKTKFNSSGSVMLHLEMYSGAATGALSTGLPPFKRRSDLLDPTEFLDFANIP